MTDKAVEEWYSDNVGQPVRLGLGGAAAACISGLWAIRFLMKVIGNGRLRWFAVYCWGLGAGYLFLGT